MAFAARLGRYGALLNEAQNREDEARAAFNKCVQTERTNCASVE